MVSIAIDSNIWGLAFTGGILVGLAAILLYATLGRIAGISGILFGSLTRRGGEQAWRLVFISGLIAGGWLALLAGVQPFAGASFSIEPLFLAAGGVAVGFGTRLGNGCTSGHGVCGLGRLSARSLAAVIAFLTMGMVTATWLRPYLLALLSA